MKNINGFSEQQTIEFLQAYLDAPYDSLRWYKHHICSFIYMRFLGLRSRILVTDERVCVQKRIWQFVAYWYDKFGYWLPVNADYSTPLFGEVEKSALIVQIESRKEFVTRLINVLQNKEELKKVS